jgi:DNA/RNA endonuclease G (NUC1)
MRPIGLRAVSVCAALLTLVVVLSADISIPAGTASVQSFDAIGTSATATLPADFRADRPSTVRTVGTYAAAVTTTTQAGGANLSGTASNGTYNFGAGTNATGADRAVGFLSSSGGTQSGNLYARFVNSNAGPLTSLQISYNVEKYRTGSNPAGFRIQLFSSPDGINWTPAGPDFLTSFPADAANAGFATAPGATVNVSHSLDVAIPSGALFYLAWNYSVASGGTTTNAQALAIDDVNVTGVAGVTPEVAPAVTTTTPANGAANVSLNSAIVINFSEPVNAAAGAFDVQCPAGSSQVVSQSASPATSFTLTPAAPLPPGTTCTVTVHAAAISDTDTNDPPDSPAADFAFSFTTANPPPGGAANVIINEVDADTPGADAAEFVELYDGGAGNTRLDGLVVVFYNGSNDLSYAAFDLGGFTTNGSGYFTLGNAGADLPFPGNLLQNGADAVALYVGHASDFPNGTPVTIANLQDAIVYGTDDPDDAGLLALLNESQPQVNENGGGNGTAQSSGRCPNGSGGARNTSTYLQGSPTPGAVNQCPAPPTPSNSPIVISQLYGGGGNAGATFTNDYVELFNRGTTTVDLGGWSLQYASASGSGWDFNKQPLGGPIAPGQYYLVSLASGGAEGAALPAANITGGLINMSATSGKVALVNSFDGLAGNCPTADPHVMDFVGYGSADCREGTTTAPSPGATTAIFRAGGGSIDTDNNGSDFVRDAAAPRRTAPIVELGPLVLATDPRGNGVNAPRDATIQVTFTEPVDVVGAWFDITCTVSGQHDSATFAGAGRDHYITPNVNFIAGERCTVTVLRDQVHDQDLDDSGPNTDTLAADFVWSFTVATGTAPPFPPSVHLTMGNPSGAVASISEPNNYLMEKPEYALSYNRDFGRPNWVSWHLSDEWVGNLTRVDTFRPDPAVPPDWYRVQSFDFAGSGFDRGHMTPNADRDKETSIPINQATFLMSNMVAQAPDNNQGPWAALENDLRALLPANELYIVAGGTGAGGTGSNGVTTTLAGGHVTVPASTWKVALVIPAGGGDDISRVTCSTRAIAVIMPNTQGIRNEPWQDFLTSVDAVEALTGYNLFSNLPGSLQQCVEAGINGNNPKATAALTSLSSPTIELGTATTVVSGVVAGDGILPTGTVTISLAGTSIVAPVGPGGAFSATFATAALGRAASPYPIDFSYAGDTNFNGASAASTLKVADTTAPSIGTPSLSPNVIAVPNHKMVEVAVAYSASDLSGLPVCSLSVTSNEAIDGLGDGHTSTDWQVLDAHRVLVRAERSGLGSGRIYTITVRCSDAAGNASATARTVAVPK